MHVNRYIEFKWSRWHKPCSRCGPDIWTNPQDFRVLYRACDHRLDNLREERLLRDFASDDDSQTMFHYHGVA